MILKRAVLAAVFAAAAIALAFALIPRGDAGAQETTLDVGVGVGSGTVAGNVFAPGEVTVAAGDSVTFSIDSDEVHTITFGSGPSDVPPSQWDTTFDIPPGPPGPADLGTVEYTGSEFINTGVIFKGSTLTVDFPEEGEYHFNCVIHPGMTGTINVVAPGGDTTTQAEADAAAAETKDAILAQVDGLRQAQEDAVTSETQPDGTTLWSIAANAKTDPEAQPGGGSGFLELLEFIPDSIEIKQGDTVKWTSTSPHTVTFLEPGQDPSTLGDPFAVQPAKPAPEYDSSAFYNSGVLAASPASPTEFELTFPDKGDFTYLCLIHAQLGQTGTIKVAEKASGLPSTGGPPASGGGGGPGPLWLWLGGAIAIAGLATVGGALRLRRS